MANKGRRTVLLVAAVCILPLVAAIVYVSWPVGVRRMNHGELLEARTLPKTLLSDIEGSRYTTDALRGKWLLVTIQPPSCDDNCQRKLYILRQVRAAQGQNMGRVVRLWLLQGDGSPNPGLVAEYPGLMIARPVDPSWLSAFPAKRNLGEHIYLVDPLGNLVLRYDEGFDPKGLINDLTRVLRVSQIG